MEFKGTKGQWFTYHNMLANPAGWCIKADDNIQTPIGVIYEPLGGEKNSEGVSPKQKANAILIAAAPDLLEAIVKIIRWSKGENFEDTPVLAEANNKALGNT